MTVIREVDNKWVIESAVPFAAPLQKGLRVIADRAAMRWLTSETGEPTGEATCRLLEWQYRVASDGSVGRELIVEELKPSFLSGIFWLLTWPLRRLSPDNQGIATLLAAILTFLVLGGIAWTIYRNPGDAWVFAGHHIRTFGGLVVLILFSFIIPKRLGLYGGPLSSNMFFSALLMMVGFALVPVWLRASSLPENFAGSDQEYAAYAQALAAKFAASYWPALLVGIPWMAAVFKTFGLDRAEAVSEAVLKAAKAR
jgi:hypothetical protein